MSLPTCDRNPELTNPEATNGWPQVESGFEAVQATVV